MKKRLLMISLGLALLAGCATETEALRYYMLAPPQTGFSGEELTSGRSTVVIETVELAEFLQQSGLVTQIGANQLQVSRNQLWAENLVQAVPRALLSQLQRQSTDHAFYIGLSDFVADTDYRMRIHIDSLQATDQGEVILAGRYQLIASADESNSRLFNFYFQRDLQQDGHLHAVQQMQLLISDLATAVLESLGAR